MKNLPKGGGFKTILTQIHSKSPKSPVVSTLVLNFEILMKSNFNVFTCLKAAGGNQSRTGLKPILQRSF